ncbi:hypothetical protein COHA_005013 [Chlorella ohadii]|uniref:Uncharacterized protein n=1 Tax=Chlorella ohadii TaxID=2649997 RepID=A0AAD5DSC4_9CHLO|nr:hypothetical protein COHA_005013 [Chlorella ohadii]
MKLLILALCLTAAAAAPVPAHYKPAATLCADRQCLCYASRWNTPVDCATCQCKACVAPNRAHVEECNTTPQPADPFFYNATAKACVRCAAQNCDINGCNSLGKCNRCAEGFGRDATGACVVGTAANCAMVSSRNATLCARCNEGFYLSRAGQCVACPAGCAACRPTWNSVACLACAPGQGLVNGACTPCTVQGCASCNGNAAKCQKCVEYTAGDASFYVLNNGTCTAFAM